MRLSDEDFIDLGELFQGFYSFLLSSFPSLLPFFLPSFFNYPLFLLSLLPSFSPSFLSVLRFILAIIKLDILYIYIYIYIYTLLFLVFDSKTT